MAYPIVRTLCLPLLVAVVGTACAPNVVKVKTPALGEPVHGVVVSGMGEAKARPDVARVRLGVEVRARSVEEATQEANQRMTAVIASLKQQGIADTDLQTSSFSVRFEREAPPYPEPPPPRPEMGPHNKPAPGPTAPPVGPVAPATPAGFFVVQNMVQATVRKLDTLGAVLSSSLAAGANDIWGVDFDVDKPEALQQEARQKAVADARAKAQALAGNAGISLGRVVSISEQGGGGRPMPAMAMAKYEMAQTSVPVEGGEITIVENVQVVFSIDDE